MLFRDRSLHDPWRGTNSEGNQTFTTTGASHWLLNHVVLFGLLPKRVVCSHGSLALGGRRRPPLACAGGELLSQRGLAGRRRPRRA